MGPRRLIAVVGAEIRRDVDAARGRDPAALDVGTIEILLAWPGVQALLAHRLAHALFQARVPLLPRLIAAAARSLTGIEIHPAAEIGPCLFIDHGMGVVIGETARVGSGVTVYQGVTLGGTGFATGKRHPTVEDDVTIGSGAKLLGPITVGRRAKIGANTVVIHDVPPDSTVVGIPGHPVRVEGRRPEGPDVDWVHLPDPIADAIKGLAHRIDALEQRAGMRTDVAGAAADPAHAASDVAGAGGGGDGQGGGRPSGPAESGDQAESSTVVWPSPAGG